MRSEKEPAGLSKKEFQAKLANSYADIAEEKQKVNDVSRPTGGVIEIKTAEGVAKVAEYEQITQLKYRKLKERYNERNGLVEGIAEYIETKLEKLGETDKEAARTTIWKSLINEDVSEAMEDVVKEHGDGWFGGIGKPKAKELFLNNAEDAVSGSSLGRLTKLIDNAISIAKNPSVTLAPVGEAVAMSIGDNHDRYPHLKDAMLDSLQKKLEIKFQELGIGKSAEQLNHLKESIIDSLGDERLDKLLGDMAKKNSWLGADAKDIKEAKKQLMDNDRFLEGIVSNAVSNGIKREERIEAGKETREVDLSSPDNTFLKTALFGMMLTASAIQGYNYLSQQAPSSRALASSPRALASSPDGSKPLAIAPPPDSSTAVSLANQGTSSDLGTSVAPGHGAMTTSTHAAALRAVDAASATGMALRPAEPSIPLVMSPLSGTGAMVLGTQSQSPAVNKTTVTLANTDRATLGTSPAPGPDSLVTAAHAADLRATDELGSVSVDAVAPISHTALPQSPAVNKTTVTLANTDRATLGTSPAPGPDSLVTSAHATDLRAGSSTNVTDMTLANQGTAPNLGTSPAPGPDSLVTSAQAADLRAGSGTNVTDISLANTDGIAHGTSPAPGPDSLVTSAHATDLRAGSGTNVTDIALANTDGIARGTSPAPGPDSLVTSAHATDLRAGSSTNATDISLANADGLAPRISPIPGSDSLVTSARATDLRAANTLDSVRVDTVAPISHATTLSSKSPTAAALDSVSIDATPGSQQRSTAPLASINVTDRTANPASQIAPLDAIQVSSSAPTVQAPKATVSKKLRKPILSPYDTFAAHNQTTGITTRSYDNQIKKLNELKADLGRLAKDSPDFIKTQFAVTKAENFLRKGRETGGDYKEHQLAVLDEKAARSKSTKEDKQRAAEYRIALANSRIDTLDSSLNSLADEMKSSSTNKTKILAAYKSAAASALKQEEQKAKGIEDLVATTKVKISEQRTAANHELIAHLKNAATTLDESSFNVFEETRKKLSKEAHTHQPSRKEKTTTLTPQEPSPYETWLCKKAEEQYELENKSKGKKFDELSEEELHKYNKQYIYANSSRKIKEYDESLSTGKVEGLSDGRGGKTFELTGGAKIKFTVGIPGGLLTPEVEGNLNAVVRVQRKRENGTLSEISDMIEFKDGKIVGFHLNTEEDPTGPTTSQLDVNAVEKLAKKLEKEAVAKSAAVAANTQSPAPTIASQQADSTVSRPPAAVDARTQPPAPTIVSQQADSTVSRPPAAVDARTQPPAPTVSTGTQSPASTVTSQQDVFVSGLVGSSSTGATSVANVTAKTHPSATVIQQSPNALVSTLVPGNADSSHTHSSTIQQQSIAHDKPTSTFNLATTLVTDVRTADGPPFRSPQTPATKVTTGKVGTIVTNER